MPRMRIVLAEPDGYPSEALSRLTAIGDVVSGPFTRPALLDAVDGCSALVVRLRHQIDAEVLARAGTPLRVIASATTGLDHIDLDAAGRRGVRVVSLKGEVEFLRTIPATAEHTWALLLALVRRIPAASRSVGEGHWNRDAFRGSELKGKTLGVIGLGRIGVQVARFAEAFGMSVQAYDPHPLDVPGGVARRSSLDDVASACDVLSVHVPYQDDTRGLISSRVLGLMPRGGRVVNTSRGGVLDEDALLDHLEAGHLAGAALDVVVGERGEGVSPRMAAYLRQHDNLIVTPHIAGATVESMARTESFVAEKVVRVLSERHG